jgi:tetratricopeptide (TPR) repeat protein
LPIISITSTKVSFHYFEFIINYNSDILTGGIVLGIFSWLLSKNTEKNSYVRRWLILQEEEQTCHKQDEFILFVDIIRIASRFGKHNLQEQHSTFQELAKEYLGDATLFEIACYTYFCMEDEHKLPTKNADKVKAWLVEIFSVAWRQEEQQISQLVNERLNEYYSSTKDQRHMVAAQKIIATKGDRFNIDNDLANPKLQADAQFILHNLKIYEEAQIPLVLEAASQHLDNQNEQLSKEKDIKIKEQMNHDQKDYLFALALLEQKDPVKACRAFTKVLTTNPENYDALVQRGQLYFSMREPMDAIEDFTNAIAVSPQNALAYIHRGKCYHKALRLDNEAIADYSMAIKLAPQNALAYFGRGEVFDEIAADIERKALENDKDAYAKDSEALGSAMKDYNQAITLKPDFDEAFVNRGLAHARRAIANSNNDHIQKAIADIEKAMALNWENGYLHKKLDEIKKLELSLQSAHN